MSPIFGPKFLSVHNLWIVADAGYFLSPIFGPKSFFQSTTCGLWPTMGPIFGPKFSPSVHQFWVVADDGYFLSPIFGPHFFFSQVVADNGHLLDPRT